MAKLPHNELGEPQKRFSETFRAASLFEKKYLTAKQIEDARRESKGFPPLVKDGTHGE